MELNAWGSASRFIAVWLESRGMDSTLPHKSSILGGKGSTRLFSPWASYRDTKNGLKGGQIEEK